MILGGFINDNGDSNHNNVKKQKSNTNVACVARFLVHFFATYDHDVNFFIRRCLEGVSKFTMIEFFSPVGCGLEGFNSSEIHLFICPFEQVGINAENFEKRRIRFNSDVLATRLPSIFVKPPHIQTVNSYDRRRKLSWFVGRIVYSTKNCGIKGN